MADFFFFFWLDEGESFFARKIRLRSSNQMRNQVRASHCWLLVWKDWPRTWFLSSDLNYSSYVTQWLLPSFITMFIHMQEDFLLDCLGYPTMDASNHLPLNQNLLTGWQRFLFFGEHFICQALQRFHASKWPSLNRKATTHVLRLSVMMLITLIFVIPWY